jgi:hypothetical protein
MNYEFKNDKDTTTMDKEEIKNGELTKVLDEENPLNKGSRTICLVAMFILLNRIIIFWSIKCMCK